MKLAAVLLSFVLACSGQAPTQTQGELEGPEPQLLSYRPQGGSVHQGRPNIPDESFKPYSFNYVAEGEDGMSSRQESGDSSGRVVGSYTIQVEDGRKRTVEYVADANGFRANVDTNEPGTDSQNPADVVFYSSAVGVPSSGVRGSSRIEPVRPSVPVAGRPPTQSPHSGGSPPTFRPPSHPIHYEDHAAAEHAFVRHPLPYFYRDYGHHFY